MRAIRWRFWRTPTYHALRLHGLHLCATALPVDVELGYSLPDGTPGLSATASRSADGIAVTLINRHRHLGTEVCNHGDLEFDSASAQLLTAACPAAANSAENPDAVAHSSLELHAEGRQMWRFELPAHFMATIRLRWGTSHSASGEDAVSQPFLNQCPG